MPHLSIKYIFGGLLIYAELLVVGLREYVCNIIIPQWAWLQTIAGCVEEKPWLIVVTACLIAIPVYYAIEQEMKRKRFSLLRFAIFGCTSLMLFNLTEAKMPGGFALAIALGSLFVGLCVLECIKLLWGKDDQNVASNDICSNGAKGFANISKADELYDLGWGSYAKILFDKLLATDVDEAYAVGLNAQWGYGKTTFLNEIKKNVTENEILVEFNPWLSSSPDQIVKDFFESLKDKLREYDSFLDDDIDNYVNLLINMDVHPFVTALAKLWEGNSSKNLSGSRNIIQKRINKIGHKIVILIDDLDRLEKDEIYEVLKLIRNTAKFQNLIYIVAYDRSYICSTLKEKGIVDPETYLYKIFQMEMLLPAFEEDLIEKKLNDELKKQLIGEIQQEFQKAIEDEVAKASHTDRAIGYFLKNFRDVKRFANLLCLEIEQVASNNLRHDILPWGLFWLELIHYSREDVYQKLINNYKELLQETAFDGKLVVKENNTVKEICGEHLFELLKYMFGSSPDNRGINSVYSYSTYFSLRPYIDKVGWSEFINALNTMDDDVIIQKMKEWLDSPEGKIPSLYTRFKGIIIGRSLRTSKPFYHYLKALEFWIDYKNDSLCKFYVPKIYHHIVEIGNCNKEVIPDMRNCFDEMVNHLLEKRKNCIILMKILTEICPLDFGDEYLINDNVIGEERITEYIKMTFNKFVEGHEIKVEDLCNEKSDIHRLIRSAKVDYSDEFGGAPFFVFGNELRDYFKNKEDKVSAAILMEKFKIDPVKADVCYEEDYLRDDMRSRIEKYFVSVNWYRNFLWQCVSEDRATIDKYMKNNYI